MDPRLGVCILPQPDDTTCGPTCLHAVYNYYGDRVPLDTVVRQTPALSGGGTLAALLGRHALGRGYSADLYTFNLKVFDPTWFGPEPVDLSEKLTQRLAVVKDPRLKTAIRAYLRFLGKGGRIYFEDLTAALIRSILKRSRPIMAGLSATYLYRTAREREQDGKLVYDDVKGDPSGHFVVISGYDPDNRAAQIADPLLPNPMSQTQYYSVKLTRLACAIMLGIVTLDANILVVAPRPTRRKRRKRR